MRGSSTGGSMVVNKTSGTFCFLNYNRSIRNSDRISLRHPHELEISTEVALTCRSHSGWERLEKAASSRYTGCDIESRAAGEWRLQCCNKTNPCVLRESVQGVGLGYERPLRRTGLALAPCRSWTGWPGSRPRAASPWFSPPTQSSPSPCRRADGQGTWWPALAGGSCSDSQWLPCRKRTARWFRRRCSSARCSPPRHGIRGHGHAIAPPSSAPSTRRPASQVRLHVMQTDQLRRH